MQSTTKKPRCVPNKSERVENKLIQDDNQKEYNSCNQIDFWSNWRFIPMIDYSTSEWLSPAGYPVSGLSRS